MRNQQNNNGLVACLCIGLLLVLGCGSDGGGPTGTGGGGGGGSATSGVFLDSAVEGLHYAVGSKDGLTNASGTFNFDGDNAVTFAVGDIQIGTSVPLQRVTPVDLVPSAFDAFDPTVTNIAAFLQTLDDDANPSNGIVITQAVRDAAVGKSIDFNMDVFSFASDTSVLGTVADLTRATQAGERPLVDAPTAQAHLQQTLVSSLNGTYTGKFTRSDSENENEPPVGSFEFTITDGVLAGTAKFGQSVSTLTGAADEYGDVSGMSSDGADFYGVIEIDTRDRSPRRGEWITWGQYYSGTQMSWSGTRQ